MTAHSLRSDAGTHPYDDEPLPAPPRRRAAWLDWLDATDPGQLRLRMAIEIVLAIGVVLAAEWLFVRATGALQVPIPPKTPAATAAELWMLNHALLVIAMMLGAILALIGGFGVGMFGTARAQLALILFLPLPMLALLAVGLTVHVRLISLALLAVVLAVGTYCRRFGPPGFMGGMLAFMGAFLGFFIQDYVSLADFGWLVAEVLIGTAGIDRGALRALPAPAGNRRAPDAAVLRGACPRPRERGGGTVRGHHPFGKIRREPAG